MANEDLRAFARDIRVTTLRMMAGFGSGHVGGAMSMADILAVLYGRVMRYDAKKPDWDGRDYLVISKGHTGPAQYAALALKGIIPMDMLNTLNQGGTHLPSHIDRKKTPGIDMSTGSLGQGFSAALGFAHGLKIQNRPNYVYTIIGDGECDEGQIWEAALYAPMHKLGNLIAFVDRNGQQLDGYTEDIMSLGNLRQKFEDFGWQALEIDGHDVDAILAAIEQAKAESEKPTMIVANTVKGKGATFAEGVVPNHHLAITQEMCDEAIAALEGGAC